RCSVGKSKGVGQKGVIRERCTPAILSARVGVELSSETDGGDGPEVHARPGIDVQYVALSDHLRQRADRAGVEADVVGGVDASAGGMGHNRDLPKAVDLRGEERAKVPPARGRAPRQGCRLNRAWGTDEQSCGRRPADERRTKNHAAGSVERRVE